MSMLGTALPFSPMPEAAAQNLWAALEAYHGSDFMTHVDTVEMVQHPGQVDTWAFRVYMDDGCVSDYVLDSTDILLPIAPGHLKQVGFPSWPPPTA